jgi:AcrR family transcriptional regulator
MRQIAEKIEYSPTTIYLYFKDKHELFHGICEETFQKLESELAAIAKEHTDPVRCLRQGAEAYIRFGLHYPHHYQVVFAVSHAHKHDYPFPVTGEAGDRSFRYLVDIISEGIQQGKFRNSDPMVLSQTAWTAMHGVTSLLIAKKEFPWVDVDVLIESVVEMIIRGIAG